MQTHIIQTSKSVAQTRLDLELACGRHGFGVMGAYDLREKMREKGVEFDRECQVVEICNPQKAKEVLDADMRISTALPCRVSIYTGEDGRTSLATIAPSAMLDMFGVAAVAPVAEEVERIIFAIMEDAAS